MLGLNINQACPVDLRSELLPQFFLPDEATLVENCRVCVELLNAQRTQKYLLTWDETVYAQATGLMYGLFDRPAVVGGAMPDYGVCFADDTGAPPDTCLISVPFEPSFVIILCFLLQKYLQHCMKMMIGQLQILDFSTIEMMVCQCYALGSCHVEVVVLHGVSRQDMFSMFLDIHLLPPSHPVSFSGLPLQLWAPCTGHQSHSKCWVEESRSGSCSWRACTI